MRITFGIVTDGISDARIEKIIASIESQNITNYEILIVGNSKINRSRVKVFPFHEEMGVPLGKKKNLITSHAQFPIVMYMHDYFVLDKDWYTNFTSNRNTQDFDIAMCSIIGLDGERYRDWTLWPHNGCLLDLLVMGNRCLLPYDYVHLGEFMYFSGGFWIGRLDFMKANPISEELLAGQGEDVEWSMRVRNSARLVMCENAKVHILKDKEPIMQPISKITNWILSSRDSEILYRTLALQVPKSLISCMRKLYDVHIRVKRKARRVISLSGKI